MQEDDSERAVWRTDWPHGSAETHALGGMTAPVSFRLPSGQRFSPLAVAPWAGETLPPDIPGHLRNLRGIFPCLPFGVSPRPRGLSEPWSAVVDPGIPDPPHGHGANSVWHRTASAAPLAIAYGHHPESGLVREQQTLRTDPAAPAIEIDHLAMARRALRLPFGWHVLVRWPEGRGALELHPGPFAFGLTYPGILEPGAMTTRPAAELRDLRQVPGRSGGAIDLSRPDAGGPSEDVLQLCGIDGRLEVRYPLERAGLRILWDPRIMPSCLLWLSRRGLMEPPWHGRFTGIGIEPVASAFDLAPEVSAAPNPISARGIATHVEIDPERPLATTLRLEAFDL